MAKCAYCKTQETEMYEKNGVPICLACATDKAAKITRDKRAPLTRWRGPAANCHRI